MVVSIEGVLVAGLTSGCLRIKFAIAALIVGLQKLEFWKRGI